MKAAAALLCLAVLAFAQQPDLFSQPGAGRLASACGPAKENYKVSLDPSQHGPVPPEAGKALVYFIHDAGIPFEQVTIGYPTTKYAVDGSWVGAGHGDSWFAIAVTPGEHHVCTVLQSSFVEQRVELAHFTAEAGKSYYFRTQLVTSRSVELLELQEIDSDQGSYLYSEYPMARSTAKK